MEWIWEASREAKGATQDLRTELNFLPVLRLAPDFSTDDPHKYPTFSKSHPWIQTLQLNETPNFFCIFLSHIKESQFVKNGYQKYNLIFRSSLLILFA